MTDDRKPVYLLSGGPSSITPGRPDPLIQAALRQSGINSPSVAYVGAASNDNASFLAMISGLLRKAGARQVRLVPLCGRRADPEEARDVIISSDLVFMSGGDVEAGMEILRKTGMISFLCDRYQEGKPFFGASAGGIMLAKSWVRWRDPDDDSSVELFPCLGFAQVFCDTHGEEDLWEELRALTRLVPDGTVTYGIPSGTALVSNPDGSVHSAGGDVHRFIRKGDIVSRIEPITGNAGVPPAEFP
jgi:cyanophycinase-like exopeptidase